MSDYEKIKNIPFDEIPVNRDIYLMDEIWLKSIELDMSCFMNGKINNHSIGFITPCAIKKINENNLEISWYPNVYDRFHEVTEFLQKKFFIKCIHYYDYNKRPYLFVNSKWITDIYLKLNSIYVMVDAIGMANALTQGNIDKKKLTELRSRIDRIANAYPNVSFISFADSILLKSNWKAGDRNNNSEYNYIPEIFLFKILPEIRSAYNDILGLDIYAIFTQGTNEYYEDALLHTSANGNHICLNSLGLPFAQLMDIDKAVRHALQKNIHEPKNLYMDKSFHNSLTYKYPFDNQTLPRNSYKTKLTSDNFYVYADLDYIVRNLKQI